MYRWTALLVAATTVACAHPDAPSPLPASRPFRGPMDYERAESWLCRPDLPDRRMPRRPRCHRAAAGWVAGRRSVRACRAAEVDCFYVYPTVDMKMVGGNHTDFSDTGQIIETTRAQVARFGAGVPHLRALLQADDVRHVLLRRRGARASLRNRVRRRRRRVPLVPRARGREPPHRARRPFAGRADDRAPAPHEFDGDAGPARSAPRRHADRRRRRRGRREPEGRHVPEHPALHGRRRARLRHRVQHVPARGACAAPGRALRPRETGRRASTPATSRRAPSTRSRWRCSPRTRAIATPCPGAAWAKTPFIALPGFYDAWCADGQNGFRFLAVEEAHAPGDVRESPIDLDDGRLAHAARPAPSRHAVRAGRSRSPHRAKGCGEVKRAFAGALALSLAACAGMGEPQAVVVQNHVSVVILPSPDELPFDATNARLEEASAQLAALAGHPIAFEFDVALLPDWRVGFQDMLIESIESVARDLDQLKRDKPLVFARGVPRLDRVVSHYDAAVDRTDAKLDPAAARSRSPGRRGDGASHAARWPRRSQDEYSRWEPVAGAPARAQDVPPAERRGYFEFLTGRNDARARRPARAARARRRRRGGRRRALVAHRRVRPEALGRRPGVAARRRAGLRRARTSTTKSASSRCRRGRGGGGRRRRGSRGRTPRLATMTDEEKLALVESVFVRDARNRRRLPGGVVRVPGLRSLRVRALDRRRLGARGAPSRGARQPPPSSRSSPPSCARGAPAPTAAASFVGRCDYAWYRDALDDARDDPAADGRAPGPQAISISSRRCSRPSTSCRPGATSSASSSRWRRRSTRTTASGVALSTSSQTAARRAAMTRDGWTRRGGSGPLHPSRHGALLYALAQVDRYGGSDKVGWERFAKQRSARPSTRATSPRTSTRACARCRWRRRVARAVARLVARGRARAAPRRVPRRPGDAPLRSAGSRARARGHRRAPLRRGRVRTWPRSAPTSGRRIATHPGEDYASSFAESKECARHATRPAGRAPLAPTPRAPLGR